MIGVLVMVIGFVFIPIAVWIDKHTLSLTGPVFAILIFFSMELLGLKLIERGL